MRTAVDYAYCMRELVDVHYPKATCIRVVQDNLSIHAPGLSRGSRIWPSPFLVGWMPSCEQRILSAPG
jgi:hypothetical protein